MKQNILAWLTMCGALLPVFCSAQVNSGSNGSDGAFNPTTNTVINMADHPTGIYQYSSVNIPGNVTVSFIPNAANTPVVWATALNSWRKWPGIPARASTVPCSRRESERDKPGWLDSGLARILCSGVAQIVNLPFRRIVFCRPLAVRAL
jgi:hypothetical protein